MSTYSGLSHIVITRMLYGEDKPFFDRLKMYKKYLLKSLKNQTNKNFNVAVLCNERHRLVFVKMGIIPFYIKGGWLGQRENIYWNAKVPWNMIEGLDMYDIQSNIDSDDYVSEEYIDIIQKHCVGDKSIHIHFQPVFHQYSTGLIKEMRSVYDENNGSAFCSLYQPDKTNYIYIGQDGHRRMQMYMDKTIVIQGHCFVGIHDKNDSTTINA
jgi:hypothetical protein